MSIKILLAIKSSVLERFYHQHRTCLGLPEASRHETLDAGRHRHKLKINSILFFLPFQRIILSSTLVTLKINNHQQSTREMNIHQRARREFEHEGYGPDEK